MTKMGMKTVKTTRLPRILCFSFQHRTQSTSLHHRASCTVSRDCLLLPTYPVLSQMSDVVSPPPLCSAPSVTCKPTTVLRFPWHRRRLPRGERQMRRRSASRPSYSPNKYPNHSISRCDMWLVPLVQRVPLPQCIALWSTDAAWRGAERRACIGRNVCTAAWCCSVPCLTTHLLHPIVPGRMLPAANRGTTADHRK